MPSELKPAFQCVYPGQGRRSRRRTRAALDCPQRLMLLPIGAGLSGCVRGGSFLSTEFLEDFLMKTESLIRVFLDIDLFLEAKLKELIYVCSKL